MQHPISLHLPDGMEASEGERVTIRVSSRRPLRAKIVAEAPPGFQVFARSVGNELDRPDAGFRVATSRHGAPIGASTLGDLTRRVHADGLTVAFGSPGRGLVPMLGLTPEAVSEAGPDESTRAPGGFDAWLNTIPDQGSEVVRTEEAMFASLACLTLTE